MRTQILRGEVSTLTHKWWVNGTQTDAGTVTIGITDAAGATVVAAGTATTKVTGPPVSYTYSLAAQSAVKVLYVTWTSATHGAQVDVVEVVGGFLFGVEQVRAFDSPDGSTGAMNSATTYPTIDVEAERARISDFLEAQTGHSWIPRYCRAVAAGTGTYRLNLALAYPRDSAGRPVGGPGFDHQVSVIISANDGASITVANVAADSGVLIRKDAVWTAATSSSPQNVTVEYEYGEQFPVDGVDRIGLLLLRDRMVKSKLPENALSVQTSDGAYQMIQAGGPMSNPTRIPEVNAWIEAHKVWRAG